MNELEYTIKQNERAIEQSLNKIAESVAKAQANVAQLTTLLALQHALYEALRIIKSNNLLNYLADL